MSDLIRFVDAGYTMIWREGRLEETLRGLDEDFEWVVPDLPEEPVRRGPDAVIDFFRDWMERFEGLDVEWELHDAGPDRVLALIHMHGTGRGSGVPVEMRYGQLWTFRDGRPARMELVYDLNRARRLAGLE
jgi:ketosteroid isomerase-like protein